MRNNLGAFGLLGILASLIVLAIIPVPAYSLGFWAVIAILCASCIITSLGIFMRDEGDANE